MSFYNKIKDVTFIHSFIQSFIQTDRQTALHYPAG